MIGEVILSKQRPNHLLSTRPDLEEYVDAFVVAQATGQPPWAFGMELPRRRFYQAARGMAWTLMLAGLQKSCPMGG